MLAEPHAAAVLDLAGRFEQQQTIVGIDRIDAPPQAVARDRHEILVRLIAEQRQAEAPLALKRAMASAGVAASPAKQSHDMPLEIDVLELLVAGQIDRRVGRGPEQKQRRDECQQETELGSGSHSSIL